MRPELKRLVSAGEQWFRAPGSIRVDRITLSLTSRCNARCQMCRIWARQNREPDEGDLGLDDYRKSLLGFRFLSRAPMFILTGGEPFLRDDLAAIVAMLHRHRPAARFSLNSNGLDTCRVRSKMELIAGLVPVGQLDLSISLDGIGEKHDQMRGRPGAYRSALATIELLAKVCKAKGLTISFTATPENYTELERVYSLARDRDLRFSFRFAQNSFYYHNTNREYAWSDAQRREMEDLVRDLSEKHLSSGRGNRVIRQRDVCFWLMALAYQNNPQRMLPCRSGSGALYLDSSGNVYPCVMLPQLLGNIREAAFNDIWTGPSARAARRHIRSGGCHCWTECEAYESLKTGLKGPGLIIRGLLARRNKAAPASR